MDELQWLSWLQRRAEECDTPSPVALGVGDDMAMVATDTGRALLSSDMLLDGVHFDLSRQDPAMIGRKAIACGLSDCAAMAVRPLAFTVSVALPKDMHRETVERIFEGMFRIAEEFETSIVGGDTTRWTHPLAIDVNVTATPFGGVNPVTRRGARVSDRLYLTGPLGGSLLGRHLEFTPRVKEAESIARALGEHLHAMIDISDGLSLDLWRICEASGVGAALNERLLANVISKQAVALAESDGRTPLEHALSDGEDFELLVAVEGVADVPGVRLFEIGNIVHEGLTLTRIEGTTEPIAPQGFVH